MLVEKNELLQKTECLFCRFVDNPPRKEWVNHNSFKRSYFHFLEKFIGEEEKTLFKVNNIVKNNFSSMNQIIEIAKKIEELERLLHEQKLKTKEYKEQLQNIMSDDMTKIVIETNNNMKKKFGDDWINSFLYKWTLF